MGKWYRAMVIFTALAAALCTSAVIYAGIRLTKVHPSGWTALEDGFVWNGGAYTIEGTLSGGTLDRLLIEKTHDN